MHLFLRAAAVLALYQQNRRIDKNMKDMKEDLDAARGGGATEGAPSEAPSTMRTPGSLRWYEHPGAWLKSWPLKGG